MNQDQCLTLPSHWTHEGVCYPGGNATLQLQGLTMGGQTSQPTLASELSVPEPSVLALFACAMLVVASPFARRSTA